ncbi:hypothetical protein DNHGIG_20650 [Collibacillus ludicampi]|uniref:DUF2334 domain-containing protein n=1 Tax=Collibacillus ludicampi TaxID=2771369 RepID=A0AAV4LFC1_9BACL|nr:DUF2334 domain-containing protein [Collibacillus ludicampi]GIM46516.1 hypothetical protein DNHGIG_20650 [Collibacillus ludicampi]
MRHHRLLILLFTLTLLCVTCSSTSVAEPDNDFPSMHSHFALLRLEDVGPGGPYATKDQLGKLRAVFDYLSEENVPFHIALIPRDRRLIGYETWTDVSIENPNGDSRPFIELMKYATEHGGILGMHGYTHQYGNKKRPDGFENTSIGREFDVPDAPESQTAAYAASRIEKSLHAFQAAGLTPSFWESPHYADTRIQREVFSSYMGILYEPDFLDFRSLKDVVYREDVNHWGNPSLGVVYIPAPLRYVQDETSIQRILNDAKKGNVLASMYFHPYLEFPYLEPVRDKDGKVEMRDGLPVYRYKKGTNSYLHQLVTGMCACGYHFATIFDVVPFSPAHRIVLPKGTSFVGTADLQGNGVSDRIAVDPKQGKIYVQTDRLTWPRNRTLKPWETWLDIKKPLNGRILTGNFTGDGKSDLLILDTNGTGHLYISNGHQLIHVRDYTLPQQYDDILVGDVEGNGKEKLVMIDKQTGMFRSFTFNKNTVKQDILRVPPLLKKDAQYFLADVNGFGKADLILWSNEDHTAYVSLSEGNGVFSPWHVWYHAVANARVTVGDVDGDGKADLLLFYPQYGVWEEANSNGRAAFVRVRERFGPWARGENRIIMTADLDGNKRADLLSYDPQSGVVDTALSFQRPYNPPL